MNIHFVYKLILYFLDPVDELTARINPESLVSLDTTYLFNNMLTRVKRLVFFTLFAEASTLVWLMRMVVFIRNIDCSYLGMVEFLGFSSG